MSLKVKYHCHFGQLTGYARAAHDYLLALDNFTDVELSIAPFNMEHSPAWPDLESRYDDLERRVGAEMNYPDVEIFHASPVALAGHPWPENARGRAVAMTTWETNTLPEGLRTGLARYEGVIVPSRFCADVVGLGAVVVPHTFDPEFWDPGIHTCGETEDSEDDTEPFYTFYSLGAWNERKNPIGLLKAYFSAFSIEDAVRLVIYSHNADFGAVKSLIVRSRIPKEELPRLIIPAKDRLTEAELLDFHRGGRCFVSATRGEGFGLGSFEAAIMGNHVIMPMFGGQEEYMKHLWSSFGFVGHQATPVFPGERIEGNAIKSDYLPGADCKQLWAEPNLWSLGNRMREAYREHRGKTLEFRDVLETHFGYQTVAKQLEKALDESA